MTGPVRVAVLGGGAGAITAAFDLSDPRHQGRYDVTVYQMGWRLGGKGASGRRGTHARIEEHGLHIWFGFYENAFRCMRACYTELDRDDSVPIRTVDDAFTAAGLFGVTEQRLDRWTSWVDWFPEVGGKPGERPPGEPPHSVGHYVVQLLRLAQTLVDSYLGQPTLVRVRATVEDDATAPTAELQPTGVTVRAGGARDLGSVLTAARHTVERTGKVLDGIELAGLVAATELASAIEAGLERWGAAGHLVAAHLDTFVDGLQDRMADVVEESEAGARLLELVDLVATIVRGLIADGVIGHPDGFDALDQYDLCEWLYLHGGRSISVDGGLLRGIYDLVFAYQDGDAGRPSFAAGQALRGMFRMFFDYRGAFAYHMQAGMGDIVFAPYYEVLRRRGVKFEFFHRVAALHPSANGTHIESVDLHRQATVDGSYEPLIDVRGLPCWPAEPRWEQLPEWRNVPADDRPDFESPWNQPAPAEVRTLRAGTDFDEIVYGLSLGSVPATCADLIAQRTDWADMVAHVGTVATQALQLWLTDTTTDLGGMPGTPVIAGYVEPLDTWADMSHLIPREVWGGECRSIHYFCSAMPFAPSPPPGASDVQDLALEQAWRSARQFVDHSVGHFLPGAAGHYPAEFRWELLVDPEHRTGHRRLRSQYVRANIAESERYVLSLPGTDRYRLPPGGSGYANLALAGDWTDTGFNAGCVEAATMSGLMAAAAVRRADDLSHIHAIAQP